MQPAHVVLSLRDGGSLDAGRIHGGEMARGPKSPVLRGLHFGGVSVSGGRGIRQVLQGVEKPFALFGCQIGHVVQNSGNGRVLVLVFAHGLLHTCRFMFAVELAAFLRVPDQFLAIFYPLSECTGFRRIFGIQPAGIHGLFHALGLVFTIQTATFFGIALQFLAVLDAFRECLRRGGVFRIKAAFIHGFFHFLVHGVGFPFVTGGPGTGKVSQGIGEFFDFLRVQFGGQFPDEPADFLGLVLVFRDVHNLARDGVDLVQVNDGLRQFHFLFFDFGVVVLRAPEPAFEFAHKCSLDEFGVSGCVRVGLRIDADGFDGYIEVNSGLKTRGIPANRRFVPYATGRGFFFLSLFKEQIIIKIAIPVFSQKQFNFSGLAFEIHRA